MILVFAGPNNSPVQPGMHTYIGSCDTVAEAMIGFTEWCRQQRLEWYNVLVQKHPQAEAAALADRASYWYQFVEFDDMAGAKVLQESQPQWQPAKDAHELHAAREALDLLVRVYQAEERGDPDSQNEANRLIGELDAWMVEWKARRER